MKGSIVTKAKSNYKQVRVTLTEQRDLEHPGRVAVGVRVLVKPLDAEWSERHVVLSTTARDLAPLASLNEVYAALLEFLAAPPLPGHIG